MLDVKLGRNPTVDMASLIKLKESSVIRLVCAGSFTNIKYPFDEMVDNPAKADTTITIY